MKELRIQLHRLDIDKTRAGNQASETNIEAQSSRGRTISPPKATPSISKTVNKDVRKADSMTLDKELQIKICRIDQSSCGICIKYGVNSSCSQNHRSGKQVKNTIKPHGEDHDRQKNFQCPMCTNKYYTDGDRREHMLGHLNEKPFVCNICDKGFIKRNLLRKHKKIHDPNYANRAKNFECDQCDKRFDGFFGLKAHKRIHDTASKKFKCEHCLKSFYNAGDRETHVRTHTKEKPLQCSKCNRGFSHSSARINHQRREHKFDCLKCTLSFNKITELKEHAKDHGEEAYCKFCDSMFPVHEIKGHLLSHDDDLPYSCKVCSKGFQTRDKLNLHFIKHTTKISCDLCKKCFSSAYELKEHKLTHNPAREKNFVCEICQKKFARYWGLIVHTRKWHTEPPEFACTGCDEIFQLESDANKHAEIENVQECNDDTSVTIKHSIEVKYVPSRPFKCDVCKFAFAANGDLQAHLKTHDNRSPNFSCHFCKKAFVSAKMLKQHVATHLNEKSYHCSFPDCGRRFNTSSVLCGHIKKAHSTKQTKMQSCNFCTKKFNTSSALLAHVNRHTNEKRFSCDVCKKRFHNNTALTVHMKAHSVLNPFKCTYCEKAYKSIYNLDDHIKSHLGEVEKKHICTVCGKGFAKNLYLKYHLETHSEDKPYSCQFCKKGFRTKNALRTHIKIHIGEKPEKCQFCSKSFITVTALEGHLKSHIGEKCFKCQFCDKSFSVKHGLEKHIASHLQERTNVCNLCSKTFVTGKRLQDHLKFHIKEKWNKCKHCGKEFIAIVDLKRHIKSFQIYEYATFTRLNDLIGTLLQLLVVRSNAKLAHITHCYISNLLNVLYRYW